MSKEKTIGELEEIKRDIKIDTLEVKVENLETSVRILEVVVGKLAMANGIKVERFVDGLVVISQV